MGSVGVLQRDLPARPLDRLDGRGHDLGFAVQRLADLRLCGPRQDDGVVTATYVIAALILIEIPPLGWVSFKRERRGTRSSGACRRLSSLHRACRRRLGGSCRCRTTRNPVSAGVPRARRAVGPRSAIPIQLAHGITARAHDRSPRVVELVLVRGRRGRFAGFWASPTSRSRNVLPVAVLLTSTRSRRGRHRYRRCRCARDSTAAFSGPFRLTISPPPLPLRHARCVAACGCSVTREVFAQSIAALHGGAAPAAVDVRSLARLRVSSPCAGCMPRRQPRAP